MGRELRRVKLDFSWPMGVPWEGFVCPHQPRKCPDCSNGCTASYRALEKVVNLLLIAGEDSLRDKKPHPWLVQADILDVGTTLHQLTAGLAGRPPRGFIGHDAMDRWTAVAKIIKAAGLPKKWGWCATCKGSAQDPADAETIRAEKRWRSKAPPKGKGYQIWETVSEGSPISPVFAKPEDLARWMVENDTSCTRGTSYDSWLSFINGPGWAPSMVITNGQVTNGVEAI